MLCSKIEIYFNITINKNKVIKINHRIIVKFGVTRESIKFTWHLRLRLKKKWIYICNYCNLLFVMMRNDSTNLNKNHSFNNITCILFYLYYVFLYIINILYVFMYLNY